VQSTRLPGSQAKPVKFTAVQAQWRVAAPPVVPTAPLVPVIPVAPTLLSGPWKMLHVDVSLWTVSPVLPVLPVPVVLEAVEPEPELDRLVVPPGPPYVP
jgi:hypothetical protein